MKDRLTSLGRSLSDLADAAWEQVPEVSLTSEVEIPIYLIHQGPGAEDYEILCDFAAFMAANQKSFLARPVLKVWAGRQDFERHLFARELRQAFSDQFEKLRAAERAERERTSWSLPSVGDGVLWGLSLTGNIVGGILLWIATETGRTALGRIREVVGGSIVGKALNGESAEDRLEELIDEKKEVVDAALSRLDITLHRDLWARAWRGQAPGPMTGMDRDAWPLPDFVQERMQD